MSTAVYVAIFSAVFAALGIAGNQWYNRRKVKLEEAADGRAAEAADDAAADRLLKLIQDEADKRVDLARKDFELAIAKMKLEHSSELTTMRRDFERQISELRHEHRKTRCDLAEDCVNRVVDGVKVNADGAI